MDELDLAHYDPALILNSRFTAPQMLKAITTAASRTGALSPSDRSRRLYSANRQKSPRQN